MSGAPCPKVFKPKRPRNEIPASVRAEVVRRSGGWCEVSTPACPPGLHRATDMHHVEARRVRNHETGNLLHLCHIGHMWIEQHPAIAYERGWKKRTLGEP